MKISKEQKTRLQFLSRVVQRQQLHLEKTAGRLFAEEFTLQRAQQLESDELLSERVEAFASRFSRLQDTLGDKLIPELLRALGERRLTVVDNLDQAERMGWIASTNEWLIIRQLRNQMVHEYVEDLTILTSALQAAQAFVGKLSDVASKLLNELEQRGLK